MSFWLTNGKEIFTGPRMKRADAYDRGILHIMQDPKHNLCAIIGDMHVEGPCTLKCLKVTAKPEFVRRVIGSAVPSSWENNYGNRVALFFSEMFFKWKDLVPERE